MSLSVSVACPGCGKQVSIDAGAPVTWVVLDKPYCSVECANDRALAQDNVDTTIECPVCSERQVEVGRTGKKRCSNDHVWENRDGVPMYLRQLTAEEIVYLREQGLHE